MAVQANMVHSLPAQRDTAQGRCQISETASAGKVLTAIEPCTVPRSHILSNVQDVDVASQGALNWLDIRRPGEEHHRPYHGQQDLYFIGLTVAQ